MNRGYPQELIDSFIDCLTDPGDFLRCSLVAHAWLPRSQSHIFRTVTLGVGVQDGFAHGLVDIPPLGDRFDNFTHFATLLQHSPHLATYVQELVLGLPPPQAEITANTEVLSATQWQTIEDSVEQFLPLLCRLKSLGLFPCGPSVHTFHISPRVAEAFGSLSPECLRLTKWKLSDPSTILCFQSAPISLQFIRCTFTSPAPGPSHSRSHIHSLRDLQLSLCRTAVDLVGSASLQTFILNWIPNVRWHVDNLQITVSYHAMAAGVIRDSLTRVAPFVKKSLTVTFAAVHSGSTPLFDLTPFAHIPAIHLTFEDVGLTLCENALRTWIEPAVTSLVLKQGITYWNPTMQLKEPRTWSLVQFVEVFQVLCVMQMVGLGIRIRQLRVDLRFRSNLRSEAVHIRPFGPNSLPQHIPP
ncbi:hypothetical protein K438DRAFT_1751389 [Mycena galopus ATCC 62051]|nr:hypothetical protein K438DRAFT_1751389 [Mycena galopus ATCC 62051]